MGKVRRSTNRSDTSLLSITQLENALHQLNTAIHKKHSPKRLFSKFKTVKLDEYRRSIIDRALQDPSQFNDSSNNNNKTSKLIPTSTPMHKSLNNKKNHTADDRKSLLLISPIGKTTSILTDDNIISGNTSKSKSQNLSKSNQNSINSIINEILPSQLHNQRSINENKTTSKRNKSIKLQHQNQNAEEQTNGREISAVTQKQDEIEILSTVELHNVQQLNKSTNTSMLNNNIQKINKSTKTSKLNNNVQQLNKSTNSSKLNKTVQQLNKSTNTSMLNNNVQKLNKSTKTSKLNNTKTCNNDELSSAHAEVEKFFEDLDNCILCINNNDSILNETSTIVFQKPWRFSSSFTLPTRTLNSLGRNSSLVKHLNEKLPTKCRTNKKKSFANKKSFAATKNTQASDDFNEQNNRQVAIFQSFMDKPDDNDLDRSDSDLSVDDLESVVSFLSSVVKPTAPISVRFCDDDDDDDGDGYGENVNNRKTTNEILSSFEKNKNDEQPSPSKPSTSKQHTIQEFNEQQIRTGLENINDKQNKVQLLDHNSTKRSKTTKQLSDKSKKTGLENINDNQNKILLVDRNSTKRSKTTKQLSEKAKKTNRKNNNNSNNNNNNNNNNNMNKRSCPSIPESSFSNDIPTRDTLGELRRSSRMRKQVQFKGTVVFTDSVSIYKSINETKAQSEKKENNRNTTRFSKNTTKINKNKSKISKCRSTMDQNTPVDEFVERD